MTIDLNKEINSYQKLESLHPYIKNELRIFYNFHSSKIAGNSLTLSETKAVLEDRMGASKPIEDIKSMQNHNKAVNYVTHTLVVNNEMISLRNIKEIQSLIEPSKAGFRKVNVEISGTVTKVSEVYEIDTSLEKIIDEFYHSQDDFISRVATFHAKFETIHPFLDGNGRTGRLLMNLELMKKGFPLTAILHQDRGQYYHALELAYKKDYSLLAEVIQSSITQTIEHAKGQRLFREEEELPSSIKTCTVPLNNCSNEESIISESHKIVLLSNAQKADKISIKGEKKSG